MTLLLACGGLSAHQAQFWSSDIALVAHRADVSPTAEHHFELAILLEAALSGPYALPTLDPRAVAPPREEKQRAKWEAAIDFHYAEAIPLNPRFAVAYEHLALRAADRGEVATAEGYYRRAIESDPNLAAAYNNFGVLLARQGREAIANLEKALAISPDFAAARANLIRAREQRKAP